MRSWPRPASCATTCWRRCTPAPGGSPAPFGAGFHPYLAVGAQDVVLVARAGADGGDDRPDEDGVPAVVKQLHGLRPLESIALGAWGPDIAR